MPAAGGRAQPRRRRLRHDAARLIHHLLRHRHADRHLGADAADAGAALLESLRHLELHVVVQVADRRHARALVDRLLDLRRHRHVLEDEAGHLEAVLLAAAPG